MRLSHSHSERLIYVCIALFCILLPINSYAENPLTILKEKLQESLLRTLNSVANDNNNTSEFKSVVPSLIGKTPQQAEKLLPDYHLVLGKVIETESSQTVGTIIAQSHPANTEIEQNTAINVNVAIAKKMETKAETVDNKTDKSSPPKAENTQKISTVKPLKIILKLSRNTVQVGKAIMLQAIIQPTPTKERALSYNFTVNGKMLSSKRPKLIYNATKAGRVIVTASVRETGGKWSHSKSQWLKITAADSKPPVTDKTAATTDNTNTDKNKNSADKTQTDAAKDKTTSDKSPAYIAKDKTKTASDKSSADVAKDKTASNKSPVDTNTSKDKTASDKAPSDNNNDKNKDKSTTDKTQDSKNSKAIDKNADKTKQPNQDKPQQPDKTQSQATDKPIKTTVVNPDTVKQEKPEDSLIKTPKVVGLPLDKAKQVVTQAGLTLGSITEQYSLKPALVITQQPPVNSAVAKNTPINLVHTVKPQFRFKLSTDKTQIKQHDQLVFKGNLSPVGVEANVRYQLLINEKTFISTQPSWEYTFEKTGSYRVVAEAIVEGDRVYRSKALTIRVAAIWQPPKTQIEPPTLIVMQGDSATFKSQSSHDKKTTLSPYWMDESGGSSETNNYTIDTQGWETGEYWVSLRVRDEQGFEASDKAQLIVMSKSGELPNGSKKIIDPNLIGTGFKPKLSLSAANYHAVAGKALQFMVSQQPLLEGEMSYRIHFGDGKVLETSRLWPTHRYARLGRYDAFVEITFQKQVVRSERIKIWVWPSWFLLGFTGISLLLLAGLIRFFIYRTQPVTQKKQSKIDYVSLPDIGEQRLEIKQPTSQHEKTEISFSQQTENEKQWRQTQEKQKKDK